MDATRKDYNLEKSGIYEQIAKITEIVISGSALLKSLLKRYKRLKQLIQSYTENR